MRLSAHKRSFGPQLHSFAEIVPAACAFRCRAQAFAHDELEAISTGSGRGELY
jgi:hypothetical protein